MDSLLFKELCDVCHILNPLNFEVGQNRLASGFISKTGPRTILKPDIREVCFLTKNQVKWSVKVCFLGILWSVLGLFFLEILVMFFLPPTLVSQITGVKCP